MAGKIIHKHTSNSKGGNPQLPTSEQIDYGELAINYATGQETIALKNSNNEIIEFKSKNYFDTIIKDKQDLLVDGKTIKTINDKSILGSGNIEITAKSLGLSSAIEYCGITTTKMYDGYGSNLVYINGEEHHAKSGCVVIYDIEEYIFDGSRWNKLGYPTDLSGKQDTLVSGQNIKTIGGEDITGNGNIELKSINGESIIGRGEITINADTSDIEERIDDIENTISNNKLEVNNSISTLRESIEDNELTWAEALTTLNSDLTKLTKDKQDALISGYNIKTIGNESIIGSGNIKFKTINGSSIIGDGNIVVEGSGEGSNIEIVNDLTTGGEDKVLSAEMGKELNEMIQNIDFDSTYNTTLEGTLATENAIGGIPKGTTVASLTAKTLTQIFDDLLFPTQNPEHTSPSVKDFNLSSNDRTVKIGSNVLTFANEVTLNKGVWSQYNKDEDGKNMPYTGDKTGVTYTAIVNGMTYTGTTYNGLTYNGQTLPTTYTTLGNHTYKVKISYSAGSAPKDNKGVEQPSLAAPAGSTTNDTNVNVTLPWYATTEVPGVLKEQSLINWNDKAGLMQAGITDVGFEVQAHTTITPQMFEIPRKATQLFVFNTNSKTFQEVQLTNWEESTNTKSFGGKDYTFYKYTYTGATKRDPVKLIVKF